MPSWAGRELLYSDEMSRLVCASNAHVGDALDLDTYIASPRVRVAPEGFGASAADRFLGTLGVRRHVAVYTSTFAMAPEFVVGTRAVLTLPSKLARIAAARLDPRVLEPPMDFPGFGVDVLWHRGRDDASLAWVREKLLEAARG